MHVIIFAFCLTGFSGVDPCPPNLLRYHEQLFTVRILLLSLTTGTLKPLKKLKALASVSENQPLATPFLGPARRIAALFTPALWCQHEAV